MKPLARARCWQRAGVALLAGLALGGGRAGVAACGDALPPGPRITAQAPGWELAFVSRPALASGKPLLLDVQVCGASGQPAPLALSADADMPAHKHGMNYRTTVRSLGPGRFQVQGMLLHMPGRWRLLFDLQPAQGPAVRIERQIDLP